MEKNIPQKKEQYIHALKSATEKIHDVCQYFGIKEVNFRIDYFFKFVEINYDVQCLIQRVDNIPAVSNKIIGMLKVFNGSAIVFINEDNNLYKSRQNFTKAHEYIHLLDDSKSGGNFKDIEFSDTFSSEVDPTEIHANTVASLLLLSDYNLKTVAKKRLNKDEIMTEFSLSSQALYRRIWNYLEFNLKVSSDEVIKNIINKFFYERDTFILFLIENQDYINAAINEGKSIFEIYLSLSEKLKPEDNGYAMNWAFLLTRFLGATGNQSTIFQYYLYKCENCYHTFIINYNASDSGAVHCPNCQKYISEKFSIYQFFKNKNEKMLENVSVLNTSIYKSKTCLKCQVLNVIDNPFSVFCTNCGFYIKNFCLNKKDDTGIDCKNYLLPDNANYCFYCGGESAYQQLNFLKRKVQVS
ncbi:ImmA/IrrE family metallo-endopeptidase [Holzapfeliella sp. JNUCC 80]